MSYCTLGKLFGLFAVFEDVSLLMGSLLFNSGYPLARKLEAPGTIFWAAAASLVIPSILIGILALSRKDTADQPRSDEDGGSTPSLPPSSQNHLASSTTVDTICH